MQFSALKGVGFTDDTVAANPAESGAAIAAGSSSSGRHPDQGKPAEEGTSRGGGGSRGEETAGEKEAGEEGRRPAGKKEEEEEEEEEGGRLEDEGRRPQEEEEEEEGGRLEAFVPDASWPLRTFLMEGYHMQKVMPNNNQQHTQPASTLMHVVRRITDANAHPVFGQHTRPA